jgi:hypothetical protein
MPSLSLKAGWGAMMTLMVRAPFCAEGAQKEIFKKRFGGSKQALDPDKPKQRQINLLAKVF